MGRRLDPVDLGSNPSNSTLYCSLVELEDLEISCLTDAELVISYVIHLSLFCHLLRNIVS